MLLIFLSLISTALSQCNYAKYTIAGVTTHIPVGVCDSAGWGNNSFSYKSECITSSGITFIKRTLYTGSSSCDSQSSTVTPSLAIFAESTTNTEIINAKASANIALVAHQKGNIECGQSTGCGAKFVVATYNGGQCAGTPYGHISYTQVTGQCYSGQTLTPISQTQFDGLKATYCTQYTNSVEFCASTTIKPLKISTSYACESDRFITRLHMGCTDCSCDYKNEIKIGSSSCVCSTVSSSIGTCFKFDIECPTPNVVINSNAKAMQTTTTQANGEQKVEGGSGVGYISLLSVSVIVIVSILLS